MKKKYQIPFDENGDLINYPESFMNPVFKDNFEFGDTLEYVDYSRGRSAAYFNFVSLNTNRKYTMFMTDFNDIVHLLEKGRITGTFTFQKRGMNYGVKKID